jgi:hypothetical protein
MFLAGRRLDRPESQQNRIGRVPCRPLIHPRRGITQYLLMHSYDVTSMRDLNPTNRLRCLRRPVLWMFLNRHTGHITVVQWPNVSLSVYIVALIVLHAFRPMGGINTLVRSLVDVAIFVWATDELLRGVNPFRRTLGLTVLITACVSLALQLR